MHIFVLFVVLFLCLVNGWMDGWTHGWIFMYVQVPQDACRTDDTQQPTKHPPTTHMDPRPHRQKSQVVKGQLPGPMTLLHWSFPMADRSTKEQALQLGVYLLCICVRSRFLVFCFHPVYTYNIHTNEWTDSAVHACPHPPVYT